MGRNSLNESFGQPFISDIEKSRKMINNVDVKGLTPFSFIVDGKVDD